MSKIIYDDSDERLDIRLRKVIQSFLVVIVYFRVSLNTLIFSFCAGTIIYAYYGKPIFVYALILTMFLVCIAKYICSQYGLLANKITKDCRFYLLGLSLLSGMFWAWLEIDQRITNRLMTDIEGQLVTLTGQVVSNAKLTQYGVRLDFLVDQFYHPDGRLVLQQSKSQLVRLNIYQPVSTSLQQIAFGQHWQLKVKLKKPVGYHNFATGFDYEKYLFYRNIIATGYVRNDPDNQQLTGLNSDQSKKVSIDNMMLAIDAMRLSFAEYIKQRQQDTGGALLQALTIGARDGLTTDAWRVLQDTGVAHLFAISGLHIGLFALLGGLFAGLIWRVLGVSGYLNRNIFQLIFATVFAGFYALLAGLSIPTQRALIALVVFACMQLLLRRTPAIALWGVAVFVVLLADPLSSLSDSFWLSFLTVWLLLVLVRGVQAPNMNWLAKIASWMKIQCGIALALIPLTAFLFHKIIWIAPLANLLAVPIVGFIVLPLALLSVVMYLLYVGLDVEFFASVCQMLVYICSRILSEMFCFFQRLASLDWTIVHVAELPIAVWFIVLIGVILIFIFKQASIKFIGLCCLLLLAIYRPQPLLEGQFRYTLLDVGQGLASVVETKNHVLVYDTGPGSPTGFNLANAVITPFMRSRGYRHIDKLMVSHEHNDHAAGVQPLLNAFDVSEKWSGTKKVGAHFNQCYAGQKWHWDGVSFEVIWPNLFLPNYPRSGNDASCVLLVTSPYGRLLITGDIEARVERQLLNYKHFEHVDVVQVPHQGSLTSSTWPLVNRLTPKYALVSSGYRNRFGHPVKSVISRYKAVGAKVYNTALDGAISVDFADRIEVTASRDIYHHYWHSLR